MSVLFDDSGVPEIIHESRELIAVNKPCGLQTEPDRYGHPDLCNWLGNHLSQNNPSRDRVFPVHRIDRPTSGLVLFARRKNVLTMIQEEWDSDHVLKTYLAVVIGVPSKPKGTLAHYHVKDPKNFRAWIFAGKAPRNAKPCIMDYETLGSSRGYSLLKIGLKTGRYHQIRAQLAFAGMPVRNDHLYGAEQERASPVIGLHAWKLELNSARWPSVFEARPSINFILHSVISEIGLPL